MYNPTREEARRFYFDTWHKYRQQLPLTDLERIALSVILEHPEYHPQLDQSDRYVDQDYLPEHGQTNPFLHLSMHLAIHEQLSIDQHPGIRQHHTALCHTAGSDHAAQHEMMDCLGEMIWHAQRHQTPPDPALYFSCLARKHHHAVPPDKA